jgi:hypothetical protein
LTIRRLAQATWSVCIELDAGGQRDRTLSGQQLQFTAGRADCDRDRWPIAQARHRLMISRRLLRWVVESL